MPSLWVLGLTLFIDCDIDNIEIRTHLYLIDRCYNTNSIVDNVRDGGMDLTVQRHNYIQSCQNWHFLVRSNNILVWSINVRPSLSYYTVSTTSWHDQLHFHNDNYYNSKINIATMNKLIIHDINVYRLDQRNLLITSENASQAVYL